MADTLILMKGPGQGNVPGGAPVSLLPIPSLNVNDGSTIDMSQYIVDAGMVRTNTEVLVNGGPLPPSWFISYNPVTELLTGDNVGIAQSLTFKVYWDGGDATSNSFEVTIAEAGVGAAYWAALPVNQWSEVSSVNDMNSVDPCPANNCPYSGDGDGSADMVNTWCGAALAENYGELGTLIFGPGGGHQGYAGDNIQFFDLATRTWEMPYSPTLNPGLVYSQGTNAGGRPGAGHTYGNQGWHPTIGGSSGAYCLFSAAEDQTSGTVNACHVYELDRNDGTWDKYDPPTNYYTGRTYAWDTTRGEFYALSALVGSAFEKTDLTAASGSQVTQIGSKNINEHSSAIDPTRDIFVATQNRRETGYDDSIYVTKLSNPSSFTTVSQSGRPSILNDRYNVGFEWCPPLDAFVVYLGGRYSSTLYLLHPPDIGTDPLTGEWTWSTLPGVGTTPPAMVTNTERVLTRFQWCPKIGCFLYIPSYDGPMYAYKVVNVDTDWADRSTASGVTMATRFDSTTEVNDGMFGDSGIHPDSTADHVSYQADIKKSGNGAMRFELLNTDTTQHGNWKHFYRVSEAPFELGDEWYVQWRQYFPEYLVNHVWETSTGNKRHFKQIILSAAFGGVSASSNRSFEIVMTSQNRGFPICYRNTDTVNASNFDEALSTSCQGSDFKYQNAVDRSANYDSDWIHPLTGNDPDTGLPWTPCQQDRRRYGGLYSYTNLGAPYGPIDPLSGAVGYPLNGWATFLMRVKLSGGYGNSGNEFEAWMAHDGKKYTKIISNLNFETGSKSSSDGAGHDGFWFTPYTTEGAASGSRQNTYTVYDEVIVSTEFIREPWL